MSVRVSRVDANGLEMRTEKVSSGEVWQSTR